MDHCSILGVIVLLIVFVCPLFASGGQISDRLLAFYALHSLGHFCLNETLDSHFSRPVTCDSYLYVLGIQIFFIPVNTLLNNFLNT